MTRRENMYQSTNQPKGSYQSKSSVPEGATHVLRTRNAAGEFEKLCDLKVGREDSMFGSIANGDQFYVDVNKKAEAGKPVKFLKVKPKGAAESLIITGLFQNEEKGYLSGKDRETGITYYVLENKPKKKRA